ncbi:MAG: hypothetical protein HC788_10095 [Sphingopyxis sp.]|nr:hypothetical protein [Sphingopyxis sp.]
MERVVAMESDLVAAAAKRRVTGWGATFVVGTFGAAATGFGLDLPYGWVIGLMLAAMLLLIPFVRVSERYQQLTGSGSPALRRYGRRFLLASFAYSITLFAAIWLHEQGGWPRPVLIVIALSPAVPVLGMIWTMARLVTEEQDEYLRAGYVQDALVATALTLALATAWGFLEMFGIVPDVPSWWVFPAWAVGLGIGQIWRRAQT